MPNIHERIKSISRSIVYDTPKFTELVVLGQQVYSVVLYSYLFLNVDQDSSICGKLVRKVPKETLLQLYLRELKMDACWNSQSHGTFHSIRESYAILGIHYHNFGYDSVFSTFKAAIHPFFDHFLQQPITDYTHLLETFAWNHHHSKVSYAVRELRRFSDRDLVFQASATFLNRRYSAIGYSKKNAIEHLAFDIANAVISKRTLSEIASSQNCAPIDRHIFIFDASDYEDSNEKVCQFAKKYGVEQFLMRFALLSRSQMGKDVWERWKITPPPFLRARASHLKKALISLGQEFSLLQFFSYNIRNSRLRGINLQSLDHMMVNIGPEEVHDQLLKVLHVTEIMVRSFEFMDVPLDISLTPKEKLQIVSSIFAVFHLSNFAPDKKFTQLFSDYLDTQYKEIGQHTEIDYRFAAIAFLSVLNIRVRTNHHEAGNGIFHAEIVLGDSKDAPAYICENESMRTAKKEVWHIAYEDVVKQVQNFFSLPSSHCSKKALTLFIKGVVNAQITSSNFYLDFGILHAKNFSSVSASSYPQIISYLKSTVNSPTVDAFLDVIYKANSGLYICIDDVVHSYPEWLKNIVMGNAAAIRSTIHESKIPEIYGNIVNPSLLIQKKLITYDYKLVQRISPLSDEIAKFALSVNLDAYNYLQFVSEEIAAYFSEIKAEEDRVADIGALTGQADPDTRIMILDSHRPFHTQLKNLIGDMKIQRITFACGYCFASGLSLLKDLIIPTFSLEVPFEMYVGALQNYDESAPDNIITGIDKATIKTLNGYLERSNFSLFTCAERFYHGKLYIFEGEEDAIICMGSSNISRSAFISNYELNIAFITKASSDLFLNFSLWIRQLKRYSKEIAHLDESMFGDNEIKQDGSVILKQVSLTSMRSRINELSNAEVQYRLNLWMSYSPDIVVEDLGILSLPNYFIFVYTKEKLIVLESFEAGNAYFCIRYDKAFEDVVNSISTFSKTEIFEYSQMPKRGYHVQNKFTLENNIRWYFRKGIQK